MENDCIFVSSIGIKKECLRLKKIGYPVYYVDLDKVSSVKIPGHKFLLVTGNEDHTIPDDYKKKASEILKNKNLIHWYTQNTTIWSPKLSGIPIGLDYHTMNRQTTDWGSKLAPKKQ